MTDRNHKKVSIIKYLQPAAERFDVEISCLDAASNFWILKKGAKRIFVRGCAFGLNNYLAARLVENKEVTKRILAQNHIPVPGGLTSKNIKLALRLWDERVIKPPVVVKPVDGSEGAAVTVAIYQKKWLARAIEEVFKYNRRLKGKPNSFLVEKYVPGQDYRFLVLDYRVLTVLRREPAYIVGNGRLNIDQLIDRYNARDDVGKHQPLCPIVRDYELGRNLKRLKITGKTIPAKKQKIYLRRNANVSTGGRSFECGSLVSPAYKKLAVRIAKIFKLRFCAVDIITPDITRFKDYAVIEVNHAPGFDIHEEPYRGRPFPVGQCLIKSAFGPRKNK